MTASTGFPPPEPGLALVLRRAQTAVLQDFVQRFAGEEITPAQYALPKLVEDTPGLRQTQVGIALGVKRTNFVPLFDALEKRGFAERQRVDGDRRAAALFLTPAGTDLLARLDGLAAAHERRFIGRVGGAAARAVLIDLLHRLAEPGFDAGE